MKTRRLVYLGPTFGEDAADERVLRCEGQTIRPDTVLELQRRRSPWSDTSPHIRVIVGSHASRADLLLQGDLIHPEHLRVYFPREDDGPTVMRAMHEDSTRLNGRLAPRLEWLELEGGEELELGPWRWRYEMEGS